MTRKKQVILKKDARASLALSAALDRRTLILAPTGNDAALTAAFLTEAHLPSQICNQITVLTQAVNEGCGAIVLAEEVLGQDSISLLIQALAEQPTWSDIPIILITSGGEISQSHLRRLAIFGPGGNVTVLERPFRPGTLLSALEVALRSRERQYEARDFVTELKHAHDKAQAASRAKDNFLATLSHELRTPLSPVMLVASENAAKQNLPAEIRADFETIRKNIELEARLIDDLLDLTRITRGKLSLDKQCHEAHGILRDALATVEAEAKQKGITLCTDFAKQAALVMGDMVRLQQVFWNVLKNAVKFTPVGGIITVKTRLSGRENVVVEITDTGIGMTPEEMSHIFNAFSQGEHAEHGGSHRFGGLGLGLAISRMLMKLHAGVIYATSNGRGQGSTFTIELPLARVGKEKRTGGDSGAEKPVPDGPERPTGRRILLVEDHEPTRVALVNLLRRRGHTVAVAGTVAEAKSLANQKTFDLVISDLGLPDDSGYALMAGLHDRFGLKGIALSGYGMEEDLTKSVQAGFFTHLIKPVRIEALDKILATFDAEPAREKSPFITKERFQRQSKLRVRTARVVRG